MPEEAVASAVSVTEVLNWASRGELLDWYGRVGKAEANKVSKAARKRGTNVHQAISAFLTSDPIPKLKEPGEELAFSAWKEWWDLQTIDKSGPWHVEERIYSDSFGLTGQPDFWTGEELYDWKVAKNERWYYHWQCNVYIDLIREKCQIPIEKYRIVLLHPDLEEWSEVKGEYSLELQEAFVGLATAYKQWRVDNADQVAN